MMKLVFFICFIIFFGWLDFRNKRSVPSTIDAPTIVLKDTIDFFKQIQPVLINHCSPCHFPGGKMYERLPFDKDTTIINHEAGILRRIKGQENNLISSFIQQHKLKS